MHQSTYLKVAVVPSLLLGIFPEGDQACHLRECQAQRVSIEYNRQRYLDGVR